MKRRELLKTSASGAVAGAAAAGATILSAPAISKIGLK